MFRLNQFIAKPRFTTLFQLPLRTYENSNVLQKRDNSTLMADPNDVADRMIRFVALHDKTLNPSKITLGSTYQSLGLNDLDTAEILLWAEREFDVWIPDEDCEKQLTVGDTVNWLCANFFTK